MTAAGSSNWTRWPPSAVTRMLSLESAASRSWLTFAETRWRPMRPPFRRGAPLKEQMRILGHAVAETADARRSHAAGAFSFMLYTVTHEAIRQRLTAANGEIYAAMEAAMDGFFDPAELPMSPGDFVRTCTP